MAEGQRQRQRPKVSGKTSLVEGLNNKWRNRVLGLSEKPSVCDTSSASKNYSLQHRKIQYVFLLPLRRRAIMDDNCLIARFRACRFRACRFRACRFRGVRKPNRQNQRPCEQSFFHKTALATWNVNSSCCDARCVRSPPQLPRGHSPPCQGGAEGGLNPTQPAPHARAPHRPT